MPSLLNSTICETRCRNISVWRPPSSVHPAGAQPDVQLLSRTAGETDSWQNSGTRSTSFCCVLAGSRTFLHPEDFWPDPPWWLLQATGHKDQRSKDTQNVSAAYYFPLKCRFNTSDISLKPLRVDKHERLETRCSLRRDRLIYLQIWWNLTT